MVSVGSGEEAKKGEPVLIAVCPSFKAGAILAFLNAGITSH
jgi:hypothetical protein